MREITDIVGDLEPREDEKTEVGRVMRRDENWEAVGMVADALDNALAALKIPMRPQTHLEGITAVVERTKGELRRAYVEATGDNPWEGEP